MARPRKSDIRQDLIDQLERNGVVGQHYLDLIEDYMALWSVKRALLADIKKRGVAVEYQNGENQWGVKKNDSVSELVKVNAQMLKVLGELGLRGADFKPVIGDDEEM
jgi:phage terminase small subunit